MSLAWCGIYRESILCRIQLFVAFHWDYSRRGSKKSNQKVREEIDETFGDKFLIVPRALHMWKSSEKLSASETTRLAQ
jgi:hypothetical protein